MRTLLSLSSCLLLLAACAGSRDAQGVEVESVEAPARPVLSLEALLERAYEQDAEGRLALLDALGRPLRQGAEPVANRHVAGQVDTLRSLVYDGLELQVYEVTAGRELLQTLRVTSAAYRMPEGLTVGSTREEVLAALGAPGDVEPGRDTFAVERDAEGAPLDLVVEYEAGRVSALVWRFYVD